MTYLGPLVRKELYLGCSQMCQLSASGPTTLFEDQFRDLCFADLFFWKLALPQTFQQSVIEHGT